MRLVVSEDIPVGVWAAYYIADLINKHTESRPFVLGLPTGNTPLLMYKTLIEIYKAGKVSFNNVVTFNMDEYAGIDRNDINSYYYYMMSNFFNHIDIKKENINLLNSMAPDLIKECNDYENKLASYGYADVFIGGLGENGHIAFNEPMSAFNSKTRIKTLQHSTMASNGFIKSNGLVINEVLTVGLSTISQSKKVIILSSGFRKSQALKEALEGAQSVLYPVTSLQDHIQAVFVADKESCLKLQLRYYEYALKCNDEYSKFSSYLKNLL